MKIKQWNEIYETNKMLDLEFVKKYSSDKQIYEKNCIEFLVELGEFINETKCFKYWSIKKPNKEDTLEEFADCITILLCFYNYLNLEITEPKTHYESKDILEVLNYTYQQGTKLMHELTDNLAIDIFNNLIYISKLLDLNENEVLEAIIKKENKIKERLESDY